MLSFKHSLHLLTPCALPSPPLSTRKGTALGDPIEVGAALAVFSAGKQQQQRRAPLELSAAKSTLGHAEPASGAAGMLRAIFRLHSGTAVGIMHLSAVNPYIAGSLEQTQQGGGASPLWMPRVHSAAGSPAAGGADGWQGAVGISGFAFQGTNAHVVLAK